MNTTKAIEHLDSVDPYDVRRYVNYLRHIHPKSEADIFRRWLFAYSSVHTTWKSTVNLYNELKDLKWIGDDKLLLERIRSSGAGMYNNRTRYISSFTDYYWKHPMWFNHTRSEPWDHYRCRVEDVALGIGFAKSAFALEMIYPLTAEVLCTDVHVLRLYGYSDTEIAKVTRKQLGEVQQHWVDACLVRDIPPVVGRWIYWDHAQNQPDSRFWTFVLEDVNYTEVLLDRVA